MATLDDVIKQGHTYRCDECKKTFKANEIVLVDPSPNFSADSILTSFMFLSKDNVITGGRKSADHTKGDRLFSCPHCGRVHLFGFDRA